jgi:hypothetical protein
LCGPVLRLKPGTNVVINSFEYMPGDFTRIADFSALERIKRASREPPDTIFAMS